MIGHSPILDAAGLQRYNALREEAVRAVSDRFYAQYAADYAEYGEAGRQTCREDLGFHLEFLRPVLEFGLSQPFVDYLRWVHSVLVERGLPTKHLPLSLDWLGEFFREHMGEPDGSRISNALAEARAVFLAAAPAQPRVDATAPAAWPPSEAFEHALLAGNRLQAQALVGDCLARGDNLVDVELHVIQPALYAIGRGWQANKVSVAQEHLATALSQSVMTEGLLQSKAASPNGKKVVLACVEGNHHCVGLQMVADAFQLGGWEVQYLGANVPTDALLSHVALCKPDLLGLSMSFAQQFRVVKDIMVRLDEVRNIPRPAVIVGGLAMNQFSPQVEMLGADAWSPNAKLAVVQASKLSPQLASA